MQRAPFSQPCLFSGGRSYALMRTRSKMYLAQLTTCEKTIKAVLCKIDEISIKFIELLIKRPLSITWHCVFCVSLQQQQHCTDHFCVIHTVQILLKCHSFVTLLQCRGRWIILKTNCSWQCTWCTLHLFVFGKISSIFGFYLHTKRNGINNYLHQKSLCSPLSVRSP